MMKTPSVENLSIIPYFYCGTNARKIIELYLNDLRETGGRHNLLHANMLEHYVQISEDREFILSLQKSMTTFFFSYLHSSYHTKVFGRKKGLISLENKCNLLLARRVSPEIKDSLGFRIILFEKTAEELIHDCYLVMDKCIDFFISEGFNPTDAEKKSFTSNFDPNKHPKIFVPKKSLLSYNNRRFVKDYVLHPKEDGYQSLHVVFFDSQGREFEVQIRSYLMDQYAESGPASHLSYKANRYKDDEVPTSDAKTFLKVDTSQIDINKIAAPSFIVTGNENEPYYDKLGIFEPRVFFELSNL